MFGIDSFAAVINLPEGAILAVGAYARRARGGGGGSAEARAHAVVRSPRGRRRGRGGVLAEPAARRRAPDADLDRVRPMRALRLPAARAPLLSLVGAAGLAPASDATGRESSFSAGLDPPVGAPPARGIQSFPRAARRAHPDRVSGTFEMGSSAREMFASLRLCESPTLSSFPLRRDLAPRLRRGRRKKQPARRASARGHAGQFDIDRTEVRGTIDARWWLRGVVAASRRASSPEIRATTGRTTLVTPVRWEDAAVYCAWRVGACRPKPSGAGRARHRAPHRGATTTTRTSPTTAPAASLFRSIRRDGRERRVHLPRPGGLVPGRRDAARARPGGERSGVGERFRGTPTRTATATRPSRRWTRAARSPWVPTTL